MNKSDTRRILKNYLGLIPAWYDLRKKEIIKDKINIAQWEVNINYLIENLGSIHKREVEASKRWIYEKTRLPDTEYVTFTPDNFFEGLGVTQTLINFNRSDPSNLPEILWSNQDRNWFISAYPDVVDYFYPQINFSTDSLEMEQDRISEYMRKHSEEYAQIKRYIELKGKITQTTYLIIIKDFYRNELKKKFSLSKG
jgi:hypothetical protein